MNYEKILKGLLSKAYKYDDGKIAEILKIGEENANEDEVLSELLNEDTQRVSALKKQNADNKDSFNQGYAKAKKLEREEFENEIKNLFGIESTTTGTELIEEIIESQSKEKGKAKPLTDDEVKKHPVFVQAERNYKKNLTEKETEYKTKIEALENQSKKDSVFSTVRESANAVLNGLNPIYGKNQKANTNIKNSFFEALKGYDYDRLPDGSFSVTKDGKIVEDAHGHSKTFEDIVRENAENYFDFAENNGGASAGNDNQQQGGAGASGGNATIPKFKSQAEADEYSMNDAIPLEQRIKALEAWSENGSN